MLKRESNTAVSNRSTKIIIITFIVVISLFGLTVWAMVNTLNHTQVKVPSNKGTVIETGGSPDNTPPPSSPVIESPIDQQPTNTPQSTSQPDTSKCDSVEGFASIGAGQSNYDAEHRSYLTDKALYDGWDLYSPEEQLAKINESYLSHKARAESAYNEYFQEVSRAGCTPKIKRPIFADP